MQYLWDSLFFPSFWPLHTTEYEQRKNTDTCIHMDTHTHSGQTHSLSLSDTETDTCTDRQTDTHTHTHTHTHTLSASLSVSLSLTQILTHMSTLSLHPLFLPLPFCSRSVYKNTEHKVWVQRTLRRIHKMPKLNSNAKVNFYWGNFISVEGIHNENTHISYDKHVKIVNLEFKANHTQVRLTGTR